MNVAIIELQRDLLLDQLMEVENQLNENGFKNNKKGYSLFLRNGNYYVKYTCLTPEEASICNVKIGQQIPTNRNLQTANKEEAEKKAKKYRDSILKSYFDKKNGIKDIIKFFEEYYQLDKSPYLQEILKTKQRKLGKKQIILYNGFIKNHFIPFLEKKKITGLNEITLSRLKDFQSYLVENGLNPNTINDRIDCAIKPIFSNLFIKGVIKTTPFTKNLDFKFNLPERQAHNRRHILDIYIMTAVLLDQNIWKLYKTEKDIKHNKIANEKHYKKYRLLCLLIGTCGLRDAEIFYLRKENIIKVRRTNFFDIVNSHNPSEEQGLKTENSKRKVPIPDITFQALNEYIEENNITDYLFYSGQKGVYYNMFSFAYKQFGTHCGATEQELKDKNFVMYSFRHFYKTTMETSDIKESIIKYFMGQSINIRDMSDNYTKREDLDDIFFEENGLKVIEYINNLCEKVKAKYELLPIHTHIEQITLIDNKSKTKTYFTEVLNDIDFDYETYLFIEDLQEKELLPNTSDKQELTNELKKLLEDDNIDKRRYDDCLYYIKNKL